MSQARRKVIDIKPESQSKPPPILDDTFFHKSQVQFGTKLLCLGRLTPNSIWIVTNIESHFLGTRVGDIKLKKVNEIRFLNDLITIKSQETGEVRKMAFIYLSYSAIWRLAK